MKLISSIQNAHLPTVTVEPGPAAVCQPSSAGVVAERRLSDAELDQHIHDAGLLMERAYARFLSSGLQSDRAEAIRWLQIQNVAIGERHRRLGPVRHAKFERDLDESLGYFMDQGDADRARVGRAA